jgi:hypothetical protein
MTKERKNLIKQLKRTNKINLGFFLANCVACGLTSWYGLTKYAVIAFVFVCIYFGLIRLFDWYIRKLESV